MRLTDVFSITQHFYFVRDEGLGRCAKISAVYEGSFKPVMFGMWVHCHTECLLYYHFFYVQVHKNIQESTEQVDSSGSIIHPTSSPKNKSTSFTALKTSVVSGQSTPTTAALSTSTIQSSQSYSQKPTPVTSPQAISLMSSDVTSATSETKILPQFVPVAVSAGISLGQASVTPTQGQQITSSIFNIQSSAGSSLSQPTPSTLFSSLQTSDQHQNPLLTHLLSKTTQPQQLLVSPKLNTSITTQTTVTSVFSHPQGSVSTAIFGQQAASTTPSHSAITSRLGEQKTQHTPLFSSIDPTPKSVFTLPTLGSGFAARGLKPTSKASTTTSETKPSGFVFSPAGSKPASTSEPVGVKPLSLSFSSALGLKSTATHPTKTSIDPGFCVVPSATSDISKPMNSGFNFGAATEAAESSFQEKEVEGVPFLPFDSNISFASLASKSEQPLFKTGKNSDLLFQV